MAAIALAKKQGVRIDAILGAYCRVLYGDTSPAAYAKTQVIFDSFSQRATAPAMYKAYYDTLRVLDSDVNDVLYLDNAVYNRIDRTISPKQGSYGKIVIGMSGKAYKYIEIKSLSELRAVFLEAFIQTVLGMDAIYGKHVCQLYGIYRVRKADGSFMLALQMERVFPPDWANPAVDHRRILMTVGSTMQYMNYMYTLYHGDLHYGNIMMDQKGDVKLIDFGMSCIQLNGRQYNVLESRCVSYDMLILAASLVNAHTAKWIALNPRLFNWLQTMFDMRIVYRSHTNLYAYLEEHTRAAFVFHNVYANMIQLWPAELQTMLAQMPQFTPSGFVASMAQFVRGLMCLGRAPDASKVCVDACVGAQRGGGRRQTRRRRRHVRFASGLKIDG